MHRLFGCTVQLIYEDANSKPFIASLIADRGEFWWNERKPDEPLLFDSEIELGEKFFNEIIRRSVPLDMNTLTALQTLHVGPRPVPMAGVPHLPASRSACASLGVKCTASSERTRPTPAISKSSVLPSSGFARAEEDQACLSEAELRDGSGRLDPASLDSRAIAPLQARSASELISSLPASQRPGSGL